MRHSQLSNEQILLALSESYNLSLPSQNIRSSYERHWTSKR